MKKHLLIIAITAALFFTSCYVVVTEDHRTHHRIGFHRHRSESIIIHTQNNTKQIDSLASISPIQNNK